LGKSKLIARKLAEASNSYPITLQPKRRILTMREANISPYSEEKVGRQYRVTSQRVFFWSE